MDNQNNRNKNNNPKNNKQGWGIILLTTIITLFLVMALYRFMPGGNPEEISYTEFLEMVEKRQVDKVVIGTDKIQITPKKKENVNSLASPFVLAAPHY